MSSSTTLKNVLVVDFEATSKHPEQALPIEVTASLFNLECRAVIESYSTLLHTAATIPNEVVELTGITDEMIWHANPNWEILKDLGFRADALTAHNAPYDQAVAAKVDLWPGARWIDTMSIDWPKGLRLGCDLIRLATAYDVAVWKPHRSATDVNLLTHIFQAEPKAPALLAKELIPKVVVVSTLASKSNEEAKQCAKDNGFRWRGGDDSTPGYYSRRMHSDDVAGLPAAIGATMTDPEQWQWFYLECSREDKHIHKLAKDWGFLFNNEAHPLGYKWMRKMDTAHAKMLLSRFGLPVAFAEKRSALDRKIDPLDGINLDFPLQAV